MARILLFALFASAVVIVAAMMRRRSGPVLEYEVHPPFADGQPEFPDGSSGGEAYSQPRSGDYPYYTSSAYDRP